jgi:hypothetical protein
MRACLVCPSGARTLRLLYDPDLQHRLRRCRGRTLHVLAFGDGGRDQPLLEVGELFDVAFELRYAYPAAGCRPLFLVPARLCADAPARVAMTMQGPLLFTGWCGKLHQGKTHRHSLCLVFFILQKMSNELFCC